MPPKIETIGNELALGEGPFWDADTKTLFYVDIIKHTLHSYNHQSGEHHSVVVECDGNYVSLIVKVKGEKNKFLIAVKNHLAFVNWDGVSSTPLVPKYYVALEEHEQATRLNDGKCDPSHRLWAGTMGIGVEADKIPPEMGSLYSLQNGKSVVKHLSKIGISNGLAWSSDKKKFYYIDSFKYKVVSYDYDDANCTIENEKTVFCFKKNEINGLPDGMTIDAEGCLWVACFNGAQVLRIDPNTGELKQTLKFPSLQITSVVFGGPGLDELYVTSAKMAFTPEQEAQYPSAGCTFRVTGLGVTGTPSLPIQL